jgi:hypothetical protein
MQRNGSTESLSENSDIGALPKFLKVTRNVVDIGTTISAQTHAARPLPTLDIAVPQEKCIRLYRRQPRLTIAGALRFQCKCGFLILPEIGGGQL